MVKTSNTSDRENEVFKWCEQNLKGKDRWRLAGPNNWYFTREKDVTMFLLACSK
jgi:hypothetical protein